MDLSKLSSLSDEELLKQLPLKLPGYPDIWTLKALCKQEFQRLKAVEKEYYSRGGRLERIGEDRFEAHLFEIFTPWRLDIWKWRVLQELIKSHKTEPFLTAVNILGWELKWEFPMLINEAFLSAKGSIKDQIFRTVVSKASPAQILETLPNFTGSTEGLDFLLEHLPKDYERERQFLLIRRCCEMGLPYLLNQLISRNRKFIANGNFRKWSEELCGSSKPSPFELALTELHEDIIGILINNGLDDFNPNMAPKWIFSGIVKEALDQRNVGKFDFAIAMIDLLRSRRQLEPADMADRLAERGVAPLHLILRLVEHLGLEFSDSQLIKLISNNIGQHIDTFDWAASLVQRPNDVDEDFKESIFKKACSGNHLLEIERIVTMFDFKLAYDTKGVIANKTYLHRYFPVFEIRTGSLNVETIKDEKEKEKIKTLMRLFDIRSPLTA